MIFCCKRNIFTVYDVGKLFNVFFFVAESAGEDEDEETNEKPPNLNLRRNTDTYIDMPRTLDISGGATMCLLEKPIDKKVKVRIFNNILTLKTKKIIFLFKMSKYGILRYTQRHLS